MWYQARISLAPRARGFHLIDADITDALPQLATIDIGVLHLFMQHTSASLTINENADPTVRTDLRKHMDIIAPENAPHYQHTYEGPDDMPAHIKAALLGNSVSLPVTRGRLALGTWQGIYLGEHRDNASARTVIATLHGQGTDSL